MHDDSWSCLVVFAITPVYKPAHYYVWKICKQFVAAEGERKGTCIPEGPERLKSCTALWEEPHCRVKACKISTWNTSAHLSTHSLGLIGGNGYGVLRCVPDLHQRQRRLYSLHCIHFWRNILKKSLLLIKAVFIWSKIQEKLWNIITI